MSTPDASQEAIARVVFDLPDRLTVDQINRHIIGLSNLVALFDPAIAYSPDVGNMHFVVGMPQEPPRGLRPKEVQRRANLAQRETRESLRVERLRYGSALEIYLASGGVTTVFLSAMLVVRRFAQTRTTLAKERFLRESYNTLTASLPKPVGDHVNLEHVARTLAAIEKVEMIQEPSDAPPALPPGTGQ